MATALGININFELIKSSRDAKKSKCLQTLMYVDDLESLLNGIIDQRSLIESETGTDPMYMAIGFLEWYESESSDKAIVSPLMFIPVELCKTKVEEGNGIKVNRYYLKITENEVILNYSLREKFKKDFDIELPDVSVEVDGEEKFTTPREYLSKISNSIQTRKEWSIKEWATLSFFSFSKLAMYQELEKNNLSNISANGTPMFSLIGGSDEESDSVKFAEDYDVDSGEMKNRVPHLISVADTSQISAIIDGLEGKNLVIEGPPGTGKSQTITNMIAALIDSGKKVLFVAEKKAALSVVQNRLEHAGLGPFCLELHSGKSKRAEVLKSLKDRILSDPMPRPDNFSQLIRKTSEIKDELRNYLDFLNQSYDNLNLSLQEMLWRLLSIKYENRAIDSLISTCQVLDAEMLDSLDVERIEMHLSFVSKEYISSIKQFGKIDAHPWFGIVSPSILPFDVPHFVSDLNLILNSLKEIQDVLEEITSGLSEQLTLDELNGVCTEILSNKRYHTISVEWAQRYLSVNGEIISPLIDFVRLINKKNDLENEIGTTFPEIVPNQIDLVMIDQIQTIVSSESLSELKCFELNEKIEGVKQELSGLANSFEDEKVQLLNELSENEKNIARKYDSLNSELVKATKLCEEVSNFLSIEMGNSLDSLDFIQRFQTLLITNLYAPFDPDLNKILSTQKITALQELNNEIERLVSKKSAYSQIITDFDVGHKLQEFKEYYNCFRNYSIISVFSKKYREAKRVAKDLFLNSSGRIETEQNFKFLVDFSEQLLSLQENAFNKFNIRFQSSIDLLSSNNRIKRVLKFNKELHQFSNTNGLFLFIDKLVNLTEDDVNRLFNIISIYNENDFKNILEHCGSDTFDSILNRAESDKAKDLNTLNINHTSALTALTSNYETKQNRLTNKISVLSNLTELLSDVRCASNAKLTEVVNCKSLVLDLRTCVADLNSNENVNVNSLVDLTALPTDHDCVTNLENLQLLFKLLKLNGKQVDILLKSDLSKWLSAIRERVEHLSNSVSVVNQKIDNSSNMTTKFESISIGVIINKIDSAIQNMDTMQGYLDYCNHVKELESYSKYLRSLIEISSSRSEITENLVVAFRIAFYSTIIRVKSEGRHKYFKSVNVVFEEFRSKFKKYDDEISAAYRNKLYNKLISISVPNGVSRGRKSDYTEQSLIDYQLNLQKPSVSVRSLLSRAPNAITSLKPVFLMSPLSVAQLLPAKKIQFDVLIMDEASQLRPEDSLGSIARAKQVIIVGDPKQMPPSNFFNSSDDSELSSDDDENIIEKSILDLGLRVFKKPRRLTWHYRSRSEKLIAFSNKHFYENKLIIFPSANIKQPNGVQYDFVGGIYNEGKNLAEAKSVIDRVVDLIHKKPNYSIMIVAMNKEQSELLTDLFRDREMKDPLVEAYVAKLSNSLEPLIIKNLENVQGDERDIVVISTVYGKGPNGEWKQNFGPINSPFGHRRLNVLFTRAKHYMLVVSSMDGDWIVPTVSKHIGALTLKNFLTYAKTGRLGGEVESVGAKEPDSDFELFVAKRLQEKLPHLKVVSQVGVAGYFIDLAVRNPVNEGAFLLGIECDGKTYHSSKSARDRDKIRQKVLEDLGWNIHRIWSTDWFSNPEAELNKLVKKIDYLLSADKQSERMPRSNTEPTVLNLAHNEQVEAVDAAVDSDEDKFLIKIDESNARIILNNQSTYEILFNGAEVSVVSSFFEENSSDWKVDIKSGAAKISLSPFLLFARERRDLKTN